MSGTHKNLKILGTAGYRVPRKLWLSMGTGYRSDKKIKGTHGYRVPTKFVMPTPDLPFIMKLI